MAVPDAVLDRLRRRDGTTRIAVVGASRDSRKYGHIITVDLSGRGYTVLPVNPHETSVGGLAAYPTIEAVPPPVHIANFVVQPRVAMEIASELDPDRVEAVWFQPGAYDEAVVALARRRFRHVVAGDCIMVVARWF